MNMDRWMNNAQKLIDNTSSLLANASAKISSSLSEPNLDAMLGSSVSVIKPDNQRSTSLDHNNKKKKKKQLKSNASTTDAESFFKSVQLRRSDSEDIREHKQMPESVEERLKRIDPELYRKSMQLLHLEELVGLMRMHFQSVSESMMNMTRSGCLLANDVSLFWNSEASEQGKEVHKYHSNPNDYTTMMLDVGADHQRRDLGEGILQADAVEPPFNVDDYLSIWLKLDHSATESFHASMQTEIMEEFDIWFNKLVQLKVNMDILIQLRFKVKELHLQLEQVNGRMLSNKPAPGDSSKQRELEKKFILVATQYEDVRDEVNLSFKVLVDKRFQIMNRFVTMMSDFQRGFFATAYRQFSTLESSPLPEAVASPETSQYIKSSGFIESYSEDDEGYQEVQEVLYAE